MFTVENNTSFTIPFVSNDSISIVIATKEGAVYNIQRCEYYISNEIEGSSNDTITFNN